MSNTRGVSFLIVTFVAFVAFGAIGPFGPFGTVGTLRLVAGPSVPSGPFGSRSRLLAIGLMKLDDDDETAMTQVSKSAFL
jgi:hypothetical protein